MEWPEPCSTSYSHLSQGSSPGIDAEQDIQHPQVISGPSVQEGAVRDVLQSPDHNRGSARLSSSERLMTGQKGLLWEQGEHQHPLPTLLQKGGGEQGQLGDQCPRLAETDPFSTTAQECGSRWSSRCWKEGCNQSRPPRKIPALLTKGKEQKQPLHSQIYGPQQAEKIQ